MTVKPTVAPPLIIRVMRASAIYHTNLNFTRKPQNEQLQQLNTIFHLHKRNVTENSFEGATYFFRDTRIKFIYLNNGDHQR